LKALQAFKATAMSVMLLGYFASTAHAQASVSVKDLSTADAAALLLQPLDSNGQVNPDLSQELAQNGIDTAEASQQPAAFLAPLGSNPFDGESGPLRILNCSPSEFSVRTYDSTDGVLWVPFQTVTVQVGQTVNLSCATSACTLRINEMGPYSARSGPQVWAQGDLRDTNSAYIDYGCGAYSQ
jgi:hypothetical protein